MKIRAAPDSATNQSADATTGVLQHRVMGGSSSAAASLADWSGHWKRRPFNGLFCWPRYLRVDGTHVCVRLDREGVVVRESKTESDGAGDRRRIGESAKLSSHRVRDRTNGGLILFHGLNPAWVFRWSASRARQAYPGVLKSLATHKTDRNDARGLAHLAPCTGFFKPRSCEVAASSWRSRVR